MASAVMRTFGAPGWPPPLRASSPLLDCAPPDGAGVAASDRIRLPAPSRLDGFADDDEFDWLRLNDNRSATEAVVPPDPGAIWFSALSIPDEDPPANISLSTLASCRA